jgi:hypothetical protein
MAIKTYVPEEVSFIVAGNIVNSWDSITIAMDEDRFTKTPSTVGSPTRTKNSNKLATLTATLPQSSSDNDVFSALTIADAVVIVLLKDNSGTTVVTMPEGTFAKLADAEFSKEASQREWVIFGEVPDTVIIGGNN